MLPPFRFVHEMTIYGKIFCTTLSRFSRTLASLFSVKGRKKARKCKKMQKNVDFCLSAID